MKLAVLIVKLYDIIEKFFPEVKLAGYENNIPQFFSDKNGLVEYFHPAEISRINQFKTFKRQVEWIGGRLAVKHVYAQATGSRLPCNRVLVDVNPNGAPVLHSFPQYCISISHSNAFAIGSICLTPDIKIGIDIEKIDSSVTEDFFKVAFTQREIDLLAKSSVESVFESWTRKEAFLKYLELGFRENLQTVEVLGNDIFYHHQPVKDIGIFTDHYNDDYIYSLICSKTLDAVDLDINLLELELHDTMRCVSVA